MVIKESEYDDLEDVDEFEDTHYPCIYCDQPLAPDASDSEQCPQCGDWVCWSCWHTAIYGDDSAEAPNPRIYGGKCPQCGYNMKPQIAESEYDDLEDVDEFNDHEDMWIIEVVNLDTYGDYQIINTNWDVPIYVAEDKAQLEDGQDIATNFDNFDLSDIPHRQATPQDIAQIPEIIKNGLFYGLFYEGGKYDPNPEGTFLESEYDDLEDVDEFEEDVQLYNLEIYDEDFVRVYSQWYAGQTDPLYAIVSRAISEISRHQTWVGEPSATDTDLTTYEHPKDLLINETEADRLIEVSKEICTTAEVPEEDKEVVDQYGQQIGGPRWFEL